MNDRPYWSNGTVEQWSTEIDNLRDIASTYANIPKSNIQVHAGAMKVIDLLEPQEEL